MTSPMLIPASRPARDVEARLAELAENRIVAPARRTGHELHIVGSSPVPQREQVIVQTVNGPWLLVDHRDDPTTEPYGGKLPIPKEVLQTLVNFDAAGVRPDHIWIGHELPEGWQEGDDLTNLIPSPPKIRRRDEVFTQVIQTVLRLTGRAAATIGSVALSPLPLIDTDPVLLGGVEHHTEPIVVWVELARWSWK